MYGREKEVTVGNGTVVFLGGLTGETANVQAKTSFFALT
jgi:hypothetical protein